MTIEDQIRVEKLQYDINRETLISMTGEETLPPNQQQKIQQAKLTYSALGKAFEKQTKAIKDHGEKQIKAIQDNKKTS